MNCQQATKHIWDYCDNKLSASLGFLLEKHCEECADCQRHLRLTRMENEVLSDSPELPPLPPAFTSRVMNNLPTADKTHSMNMKRLNPGWLRQNRRWTGSALLGLLLLVVMVPMLLDNKLIPWGNMDTIPGSDTKMAGTAYPDLQNQDQLGNADVDSMLQLSLPSVSTDSPKESNSDAPTSVHQETAVSSTRQSAVPTESSRGGTVFPYSIHLPAAYTQVNSPVSSGDSVVYRYVQGDSEYMLEITVTRLPVSSENAWEDTLPPATYSTSDNAESSAGNVPREAIKNQTSEPVPPAHINSVVSWIIKDDDHFYRITIDGNLSPQELALLAGSIKFQKGS